MKIENQVCSLEQARRLKEMGIDAQGHFCYAHPVKEVHKGFDGETTEYMEEYKDEPELMELSTALWNGLPYCHAYTVAELGVMLDDFVNHSRRNGNGIWEAKFKPVIPHAAPHRIQDAMVATFTTHKTEAEARASLLIHLLETSWLDAEKCNERLSKFINS